jgi:transposase-like protein
MGCPQKLLAGPSAVIDPQGSGQPAFPLLLKNKQVGKMEAHEKSITLGDARPVGTVTSGDVIEAFCPEFFNEDHCRHWFIKKLHPEKIHCPYCEAPARDDQEGYLLQGKKSLCRSCRKPFTAFTQTRLSGVHCRYSELVMMILLVSAGWSVQKIADKLGRNDGTIRHWRDRFID